MGGRQPFLTQTGASSGPFEQGEEDELEAHAAVSTSKVPIVVPIARESKSLEPLTA